MRTKYNLFIVAIVIGTALQSWMPKSDKRIEFTDLSWLETLAKAKAENRFVFVYVYADWCSQCKQLKRTSFKDEKAAAYFNKNFINIAVNGEDQEGARIAKKYAVKSYPTLLIVDARGNLQTKTAGVLKPHILINFGRRIVP